MSYDLQPGGGYRPPMAPSSTEPQFCSYCGAPLSEFYYFCLACATPYKNVDAVITAARPRQLTGEEMVARKAPHVKTLFWTYFGVILGVGLFSAFVFREDRPDLHLLLNEIGLLVTTAVFGYIHRRVLFAQFRQPGFNKGAAYVALLMLGPLLGLNFGIHWLLSKWLGGDREDFLSELREANVSEAVLIVTFCVMPAILEEIAFRGLIQHWLQSALVPWKALVLASFLFALVHFSVLSFWYLFLVGCCLGWAKQKTASLYPSMLVHFLHNFVVIEFFR